TCAARVIAAPMKILPSLIAGLIASLALLLSVPAHAIVGGGAPSTEGVARSVVTIVGSRGNFCTGALIAPKLVLSAAHCVQPGARDGLGACTGDSGAPVFEDKQGGPVIVGVVSWSTGPNGLAGCGGMTGVTPLTLYREWIVQTTQKWGAGL